MRPSGVQPTSIEVEAKVIGPDGRVKEDLGTVAYAHRNPAKHLLAQRRVRGGGIVRTLLGRAPRVRR